MKLLEYEYECIKQLVKIIFFTGFAFIEFEDIRDAEDAVRDMDGRYVCGVRIRVEMARNSSKCVAIN